MEPTCINLQERFGDTYKISWDPAYNSSHVPIEKRDPWMMQIPCAGQGVTIYPHGGDVLALEVNGHSRLARTVAVLPGVTLWQDGDGEKTFLFDVGLFNQVAAIVKPRRRVHCHLSTEQRAALAERGRKALAALRATTESAKTGAKPHPEASPLPNPLPNP